MASVTVRSIPDDLMGDLRAAARVRRRSLNAQVLAWLDEARRQERAQGELEQLLGELDRHVSQTRRRRQRDSTLVIRHVRDAQ